MAIRIARGHFDEVIERIIDAFRAYEADHPNAQIDLYRPGTMVLNHLNQPRELVKAQPVFGLFG